MGQNQTINQTKDDISCYKCKCHYLLELISIENSISLISNVQSKIFKYIIIQ